MKLSDICLCVELIVIAFVITVLRWPTIKRDIVMLTNWWRKKNRHWFTTVLGLCAMALGVWSFIVHWIPYQTVYFNLVYVEVPSIGLIFAGWIGLHAADGRHVK